MELNSVLFPAPSRKLTEEDLKNLSLFLKIRWLEFEIDSSMNLEPNLIWIPVYESLGGLRPNTAKLATHLQSYFKKKSDHLNSSQNIAEDASHYSNKSDFSQSAVAEGLSSSTKPRKSSLSRFRESSEEAQNSKHAPPGLSSSNLAADLMNTKGIQKRANEPKYIPMPSTNQTANKQRIGPRVQMSGPLGAFGDRADTATQVSSNGFTPVSKEFKDGIQQAVRVSAHKLTMSVVSAQSSERRASEHQSKISSKTFKPFSEVLVGISSKPQTQQALGSLDDQLNLFRHRTTLDFSKHICLLDLPVLE